MLAATLVLGLVGVGSVVVGSETPGNLVEPALVERVRVATDDGMALPVFHFLSEDEEVARLRLEMLARMALGRASDGIAVQMRGDSVRLTRFAATGAVVATIDGSVEGIEDMVSALRTTPPEKLAMFAARGGTFQAPQLTPPRSSSLSSASRRKVGKWLAAIGGVGLVLDTIGMLGDWARNGQQNPIDNRAWSIAGGTVAAAGLVGATILFASYAKHRRRR